MRVTILVSNKITKFYSVDRDEFWLCFRAMKNPIFEMGIVFELYAFMRDGN